MLDSIFLIIKNANDKKSSKKILQAAETVIRNDPIISNELGVGIEAGGIYASKTSSKSSSSMVIITNNNNPSVKNENGDGDGYDYYSTIQTQTQIQYQYQIMIIEFQLNGGNSWAQARVCGIQKRNIKEINTIHTEEEEKQLLLPDSNNNDNNNVVQLISLGVANMDVSFYGGWVEVKLPPIIL